MYNILIIKKANYGLKCLFQIFKLNNNKISGHTYRNLMIETVEYQM